MLRSAAAGLVDLVLLAGGIPLAVGLARLGAGPWWPWAALFLGLAGATAYALVLRASPLKATLGQDLLGVGRGPHADREGLVSARAPAPGASPTPGSLPPAPPPAPAEVLAAPGSTSCPRCGRSLSGDARFCGGCGSPVEVRRCPSCAHPLSPDARFCSGCGGRVP